MTEIKGWRSEGTFLVFDHRLVLSPGHFFPFFSFFFLFFWSPAVFGVFVLLTSLWPGEEFVIPPLGRNHRAQGGFSRFIICFIILCCVLGCV